MNKKGFTWTQIALVIIGLVVVYFVITVFILPILGIEAPGPPKACCTNCVNCATEQDCNTCTDCQWVNNQCIEET